MRDSVTTLADTWVKQHSRLDKQLQWTTLQYILKVVNPSEQDQRAVIQFVGAGQQPAEIHWQTVPFMLLHG